MGDCKVGKACKYLRKCQCRLYTSHMHRYAATLETERLLAWGHESSYSCQQYMLQQIKTSSEGCAWWALTCASACRESAEYVLRVRNSLKDIAETLAETGWLNRVASFSAVSHRQTDVTFILIWCKLPTQLQAYTLPKHVKTPLWRVSGCTVWDCTTPSQIWVDAVLRRPRNTNERREHHMDSRAILPAVAAWKARQDWLSLPSTFGPSICLHQSALLWPAAAVAAWDATALCRQTTACRQIAELQLVPVGNERFQ